MKQFFILLLLLFFNLLSYAQERNFHHISDASGLTNKVVKDIYRDQKGFLWLGTQNGLHRYDGYEMKIYRSSSEENRSLSTNDINVIFEDDQQQLWVGTTNNIHIMNTDGEHFTKLITQSPFGTEEFAFEITSIIQAKTGTVWVGTKGAGLYQFNTSGELISHHLADKQNPYLSMVNTLAEDKNGNIWIGHEGLNLSVYNHKRGIFNSISADQHKTYFSGNGSSEITKIVPTDRKGILVGTLQNGVFSINPSNKKVDYLLETNKGLKHPTVKDIVIDGFQNIWVATSDGLHQLSSYSNKVLKIYRADDLDNKSIASNALLSLHYDKQHILWVSVSGQGVDYIEPNFKKFKTYKREVMNPNSLKHTTVQAIFEDSDRNLWFGTSGGGISFLNTKTKLFEHHLPEKGNPDKLQVWAVFAIHEDHKKNIWVGSYMGGLSKFNAETKTFKTYKNAAWDNTSLPHDDVRDIFEDSKKNLWIATNSGGVALFDAEKELFKTFKREEGKGDQTLSSNWTLNIFEDSRGWIWVGTYGGLSIYYPKEDRWINFMNDKQDENSLAHNWVYAVHEDQSGNMWIGTAGGLNKIEASKLKAPIEQYSSDLMITLKEAQGLSSNSIHGILEDEDGVLWLSSNSGLSKFDHKENEITHYTKDDGLQGNEFIPMAFCKTHEGRLFFGGNNGANAFYPNEIINNPYKPNICLTNFSLFNREVKPDSSSLVLQKNISITDEINLHYDQNVLTFSFVALNMISPEKNQYAYMLEGFDKDWNYVDDKREAIYTNLDPGDYIFRVKGSNNDGLWNEDGQEVLLIIKPPYWQTWWFRLMVFLVLLLSIFLGYQWKVRAYKKEQQILEKTVKDRTRELAERNNDLVMINEEVQQQAEELEMQRDNLSNTNKLISERNLELNQKNNKISTLLEQLQTANGEITQKNRHITDSIRYAQTMQEAILPITDQFSSYFQNHFILFKPKDIVSGDFYWVSVKDEKNRLFIASVDCTGHGVPGAFMSMIGMSLLNKIVNEYNTEDPSAILIQLDEGIRKALKQDHSKNSDGMDLSIVRIDQNGDSKDLCFSSAKGSMYIYRAAHEELQKVVGDKISIGGIRRKKEKKFTEQHFQLQKNDRFFLLTDGYIDQCDEDRKKFGTVKFEKILNQTIRMPLDRQYQLLLDVLRIHQGEMEQRDDITILGFEI
ncbi:two-component regulator propeller domain-containing protein [Flammeovirga aprica]|uniref:SpoIIE family protein phosphatase n=1 Tax=Flammeovirga aprica JL-4 TaxID=694437 RepID=A0A7X9RYQ9_9BACT|nr:two-component regulator propeller domain-containing protein [Flammeovirga aprica]NME71205.1 SpoIIE family protein phosphatase [Flammeovirga aprica JL-4]